MESGLHADPEEGHLERTPDPQATVAGLLHSRFSAGAGRARRICSYLAFAHVLAEGAGTGGAHHFPAGTDDSDFFPHLRDRPAGVHQSAWSARITRVSAPPS